MPRKLRPLAAGLGLAVIGLLVSAGPAAASSATFVRDINGGPADSIPQAFGDFGGAAMFFADDGVHGNELWRSDGTSPGTKLVRDIYPGPDSSEPAFPYAPVTVDGTLFFAATDGPYGTELWRSDGTATGTKMVRDLYPGATGSYPSDLVSFGGKLFFAASDHTHGIELWRSDGTAEGTQLVSDIHPGGSNGYMNGLTVVGDSLYFAATDGVHGVELWRSDGTRLGTEMVRNIRADASLWNSGSNPQDLTVVGQDLFFIANDGTHGTELWRSDGTADGTQLVRDIHRGRAGTPGPYGITKVGETVFLAADDGIHGTELWRSDGTPGGTRLARDINPGSGSSYPYDLEASGGDLFLTADDGTHGTEVWHSDGTTLGTKLVRSIRVGARGCSPGELTDVGGTLFFRATDGTHGFELWRSDGTVAGTTMINIRPEGGGGTVGGRGSVPRSLTNIGGTLFFGADDGTQGRELWKATP